MKKIITLVIVILVSTVAQMMVFVPWWSFLVPVFLLGLLLPLEKWNVSPFITGFAAGFLVWLISTLYFEAIYKGEILHKISKLLTSWNYLIYLIVGFIGGILTGLGLYSGFLLRRGKEALHLDF
jgi:hypothetical protein